jgi:hypothetical protein
MLLSQNIIMKWNPNNIKHYTSKGYTFTHIGNEFRICVNDLPNSSHYKVDVTCDKCGKHLKMEYVNYNKQMKQNNGKIHCWECSKNVNKNTFKNRKSTKRFKKSKSFYDWCIENNRQDLLDRWDYELNKCSPKDISYGTNKKYYFKCPNNIHNSASAKIIHITRNNLIIKCLQCNSFAQWGIDNICSDFLEKYWDYEKNIGINPWNISHASDKKVWIKCQKVNYHGSYLKTVAAFTSGKTRCPYCYNRKIHPLDSLGAKYPQVLSIWSDKNKKSPYEYAPMSKKKVWWKCSEEKHEDYYRSISDSVKCNFRCPECDYSKGEERIDNYFKSLELNGTLQELYNELSINSKTNIDYITQYSFDQLTGVHNGLLSYDFYLPYKNLLIEYQGKQHEQYIKGFHKSMQDFKIQQEHDKRKREYAKDHNIGLLEIWYWDYENIEKILEHELKGD